MDIFKRLLDFTMDILETVTFVGSLFIVVYLFVMQPHQIRGPSMEPTFQNAEYILTNKLAYRFGDVQRGDVIVFKSPDNDDKDFIKRIIAVPGDTVRITDGTVTVNEEILNEDYISATTTLPDDWYVKNGQSITIQEDYIFVMGDNRPRSQDSRFFGPIPQRTVIGKVFFRYFPTDKIGTIPNPYSAMRNVYLAFTR